MNLSKLKSVENTLMQITKATLIIQNQESIKDNDLERLKELLPFFNEGCIEEYNYGSVGQISLDAIAVCQRAANNYVGSDFSSITINHDHYNNDTSGRDHYMNKLVINDGEDKVEISLVTILDRDSCSWELTREEPISILLNDKEVDDLFEDDIDAFSKLINEELSGGFHWNNQTDPAILAKAHMVISKNEAAIKLLTEVEGF